MSKKDDDNIPNSGRSTLITFETNAYLDHSIAAPTFGAPLEEHDDDVSAVARSLLLETPLDEDDHLPLLFVPIFLCLQKDRNTFIQQVP